MRIAPALVVIGALTVGACGAPDDVQSTSAVSTESGDQLPPVVDPSTTDTETTIPGTRPADFGSMVLLASDLPGWDVVRPMDAPGELTWEANDCPDMNHAWGVTGLTGTRSRGSTSGVAFRNTAHEFTTPAEAADVLDAVDRVWSECTIFESTLLESFWSEPIVMPTSTHRTSGLVIGSDSIPNWTLAYWQVDATVVVLEIEGSEMWAYLDPLLATLSARLDGNPTPIHSAPSSTLPPDELPVLVPVTSPQATTTTTTTTIARRQDDTFPPTSAEWAKHPLAKIAPAPGAIGPDWVYEQGDRNQARPANPDDAVEGCDAPVPPMLDGFEVAYSNVRTEAQIAFVVGVGTTDESQIWVDAFRSLAGCDLTDSNFNGSLDNATVTIAGADDAFMGAGEWDLGFGTPYAQVIGVARVGEIVVIVSVTGAVLDAKTTDLAKAQATALLTSALAGR